MSDDKSTVDVRRERRMMRAFQNPVVSALLRRLVNPQDIIESGMAFWSSRLVMTAVEKGVFTLLAQGPMSVGELTERLGWHPRADMRTRCGRRRSSTGTSRPTSAA
jgi:hypothetical protein